MQNIHRTDDDIFVDAFHLDAAAEVLLIFRIPEIFVISDFIDLQIINDIRIKFDILKVQLKSLFFFKCFCVIFTMGFNHIVLNLSIGNFEFIKKLMGSFQSYYFYLVPCLVRYCEEGYLIKLPVRYRSRNINSYQLLFSQNWDCCCWVVLYLDLLRLVHGDTHSASALKFLQFVGMEQSPLSLMLLKFLLPQLHRPIKY